MTLVDGLVAVGVATVVIMPILGAIAVYRDMKKHKLTFSQWCKQPF